MLPAEGGRDEHHFEISQSTVLFLTMSALGLTS